LPTLTVCTFLRASSQWYNCYRFWGRTAIEKLFILLAGFKWRFWRTHCPWWRLLIESKWWSGLIYVCLILGIFVYKISSAFWSLSCCLVLCLMIYCRLVEYILSEPTSVGQWLSKTLLAHCWIMLWCYGHQQCTNIDEISLACSDLKFKFFVNLHVWILLEVLHISSNWSQRLCFEDSNITLDEREAHWSKHYPKKLLFIITSIEFEAIGGQK